MIVFPKVDILNIQGEDVVKENDLGDRIKESIPAASTGLILTWIEYEILRSVSRGVNTMARIQSYVENKYSRVRYSQSQYYRIASKLVEEGFIATSMKDGKKKEYTLTQMGVEELGHLRRYVYDFIQEATIIQDINDELVANITGITGCLRNLNLLTISPKAYSTPQLMDACKNCANPVEEMKKPIFLALRGAEKRVDIIHEGMIQYIDAEDEGDWLPKDESMDIVMALSVMQVFNPETILKEVYRILKPGGYFVSLEIANNVPKFVLQVYNDIVAIDGWRLQTPLLAIQEIEEIIRSKGFTILGTKVETVLTSILARKA